MPTTPYTGSTQPVDDHQAQKVPTYNQVTNELDASMNGFLSLSVAGSSNVTLTTTQGLVKVLKLTGALTGNITVFFRVVGGSPAGYSSRMVLIWNATTGSFTVTIKTTAAGSTGIDVTQDSKALLFHDGTNVYYAGPEV